MRITDSHQHFWRRTVFDDIELPPDQAAVLARDYQPQDLKPLLDAEGVQGTVFVQGLPQTLDNTHEMLALAGDHPWIEAVVAWVDLTAPAIGDVLDQLCEFPVFKGVRHIWELEPDPAWIVQPGVLRGLRALAGRNLTFDLLADPPRWPYLAQVASAIPDLRMVLDHIGKPDIAQKQFDNWANMMAQAAQFPQMMVKLSGMITEAHWQNWQPADLRPYVSTAIEKFGVERVMFGSDWPVCLLAGSYHQVLSALRECISHLTEGEQGLVLGANARAFYGIA
jgi:L-fuconolactonase